MASDTHPELPSRSVPRPPNKPKKGESYRMHVILPGELVAEVDAVAEAMTSERPGLAVTRTDVCRMAIHEFIQRHLLRAESESEVLAEEKKYLGRLEAREEREQVAREKREEKRFSDKLGSRGKRRQ